jgi:hypothetical protein
MITFDKRKDISLFSIRANFQVLMYLLSQQEKKMIYKIIQLPFAKEKFYQIHFENPYLVSAEITNRQNNTYVNLIHAPELKQIRYTPFDPDSYEPNLGMLTKIYIEFRMLNFILEHILKTDHVTLELIETYNKN